MAIDYHAHLTVHANALVPTGWKRTDIVLEGDRSQLDIMLTKHYRIGTKKISNIGDILADIKSLSLSDIIRIKIEQDSEFSLPISESNYLEIHMLMSANKQPIGEGWVRSRNPRKTQDGCPLYFYNRRIYSGESICVEAEKIKAEQNNQWMEFKVEQAIFDSNREHDLWWA